MVRIRGTAKCKSCIWGGEYSEGCSYMADTGHSRLIENGKRYNPDFCSKYKEGVREHGQKWKEVQKRRYKNGKHT